MSNCGWLRFGLYLLVRLPLPETGGAAAGEVPCEAAQQGLDSCGFWVFLNKTNFPRVPLWHTVMILNW